MFESSETWRQQKESSGSTGGEWRWEIRGRRKEERMSLEAPVNEPAESGLLPCFH